MAIINGDSSAVVVDAVLTKEGRRLLAKGREYFNITKYAFADDEVDYGLWNPNHVNGTDYYGVIIENLPLMEASTDGNKSMRNKLISLNKDQTRVSRVTGVPSSISIGSGEQYTITPQTNTGVDDNAGYTIVMYDSRAGSIRSYGITNYEGLVYSNETSTQLSTIGKSFDIMARDQSTDLTTTIVITGNESGASTVITLVVYALEVLEDGSTGTSI
jgi:hypothetical protein